MSFKVVLIKEMQEIEPVPAEWEVNGILYWPADEKLRKLLQSNKNSCPDKETWTKYHCLVKANNILFYGDASKEAQFFISNTTEDESYVARTQKRVKNPARRIKSNKHQKKYHFEHLLPTKKRVGSHQNTQPLRQSSPGSAAINSEQLNQVLASPSVKTGAEMQPQSSTTNLQFRNAKLQPSITSELATTNNQFGTLLQTSDGAEMQPQSSTTNLQFRKLVPSHYSQENAQLQPSMTSELPTTNNPFGTLIQTSDGNQYIQLLSSQSSNTNTQSQQFTSPQSLTANSSFRQLLPNLPSHSEISVELLQHAKNYVVANSDESQQYQSQNITVNDNPNSSQYEYPQHSNQENKFQNDVENAAFTDPEQDTSVPDLEDYFREYCSIFFASDMPIIANDFLIF